MGRGTALIAPDRACFAHHKLLSPDSMVVFEINVCCIVPAPPKGDTPILVDRKSVSLWLAVEGMEPCACKIGIGWRAGSVQDLKQIRNSFDKVGTKATAISFFPELPQCLAAE